MMEAENAVAIVTCGAPRQADKRALAAAERAAQCTLLRDIFGNPFHPITLNLSWLTPTVLAQDVYDHRSFDRLPELAQALQDAGCEDAELLAHLRGPGPHVKGCHALDLLLAKQ